MAQRAAIGITAFTLLMLTEIIFSWLMRGWSFETWLNHFGTADGAISLAMFLTFAALPLVVRRG